MGLYKRGNVYWVQFKHQGEVHRESTGETDYRRAAVRAAQIKVEAYAKTDGPRPGHCSLEQIAATDLLRAEETATNPKSVTALKYSWRKILGYFGPEFNPETLEYDGMESYIRARRKDGAKGQTIRREAVAMARGCQIAYRKKWIQRLPPEWPTIKADSPNEKQQGKWHPLEIVKKWLAQVTAEARDEILFTLYTGLRYTEVKKCSSTWIEPSPPGYDCPAILKIPAHAAKTRKPRIVPLQQEALDILKRRGSFGPERHIKTMSAACKRIGYDKNITMRDLRHIAASIADQTDRKATQDLLGHTTVQMTGRYLHSSEARLSAASAAIAKALTEGDTTEEAHEGEGNDVSAGGRSENRTHDIQLVRLRYLSKAVERLVIQDYGTHRVSPSNTQQGTQSGYTPGGKVAQGWRHAPLRLALPENDNWLAIVKEIKEEIEK